MERKHGHIERSRGIKIITVLVRFNKVTAKKNHSEQVAHLKAHLERKLMGIWNA